MKKLSFCMLIASSLTMLSLFAPVRGDNLDRCMDQVDEGMLAGRVIGLAGQPTASQMGNGGHMVFTYKDPYERKTWVIVFERNRVDSIKETHDEN